MPLARWRSPFSSFSSLLEANPRLNLNFSAIYESLLALVGWIH